MKIQEPFASEPKVKALFATSFFAIIGIISWSAQVHDLSASLPLGIFYAVLVLNTYFSIAFFSSIIPKDNDQQKIIDGVLVLLYMFAALELSQPLWFLFALLLLFLAATAKYALLLGVIRYTSLLRKKLLVDLLGAGAISIALGLALLKDTSDATWLLTIGFCAANWYLLVSKPLYQK